MKSKANDFLSLASLASLVAFLAVFRNIEFLKNPTFYAEEGTYFFAQSYQKGWNCIWQTYSGYLQLPQTIITCLSLKLFSLENAPRFTAYTSIIITLIPTWIICFGRSIFNWGYMQKAALAIGTIICATEANSYSVIHFNFLFSWIVSLILFEDGTDQISFKSFVYPFLLFLAPLAGPVSAFLLPFFLYNYWQNKNKTNLIWVMALGFGVAISVGFFIDNLFFNPTSDYNDRFKDFNLSDFLMQYLFQFLIGNSFGYFEEINRPIAILTIALFGYFAFKQRHDKNIQYLVLLILYISILPMVFSLGMKGGVRYFYTSNLLFLVFLLHLYDKYPKLHYLGLLAIGVLLVSGITYLPKHQNMTNLKRIHWAYEVNKWKHDPNYELKIYPFSNWDTTQPWRITLKK